MSALADIIENTTPSQRIGALIAAMYAAIGAYFWHNDGLFGKMWVVVSQNNFFWIAISLGVGWAIYRKFRKPEDFTWLELPVQVAATCLGSILVFAFFFYTTTDLKDYEFLNGKVTRVEYHEEWTGEEEHSDTDCDSDGNNCTTRTWTTCSDYNPPTWTIYHSTTKETSTNNGVYRTYVAHFGNEDVRQGFNMSQCSVGDGRVFVTSYKGETDKLIPSSTEHQFVNYLKGSHETIRRRTGGNTTGHEKLLRPYPRVHGGNFGEIEVDRVIAAGIELPSEWTSTVDRSLDRALVELGARKQVDILVYVVATGDQAFFHALEEHWVSGKKNDVVVIIGAPTMQSIAWAAIMAWTDIEEFKIELRDRVTALHTLEGNAQKLADTIIDQVGKPADNGGFRRQPMSELAYLAGDVTLPWWSALLIILIMGGIAWLVSWALENNEVRS